MTANYPIDAVSGTNLEGFVAKWLQGSYPEWRSHLLAEDQKFGPDGSVLISLRMTKHQMSEQTQQHYTAVMGSELGRVFYRLLGDFLNLRLKWDEHVELFGKDNERIELLNQAAGSFSDCCKMFFGKTCCFTSAG